MPLARIVGTMAALILVLSACSGGSGEDAGSGADDGADTESVPQQDSSRGSDAVQFASLDELMSALRLTCEPAGGDVASVSTQPDESVACGDTIEVDWYEDQDTFEQARSEVEDQICSEVNGDWSYLVGDRWALTAQLPTESGSDDDALQILALRGGAGEVVTYSC